MSCFVFAESQSPIITASPSNNFLVVEGENATLEWTYNLNDDFANLSLLFATVRESIIVVRKLPGRGPTVRDDRVTVIIMENFTSITFFGVNGSTDDRSYDFEVGNNVGWARRTVRIAVLCK